MEQILEIKIDRMGKPSIEAKGFEGSGCTQATESIEAALMGQGDALNRTLKPEFYNESGSEVQQELRRM